MALITVFGVNGVGKDTVIERVGEQLPDLEAISETKLLMYNLGITAGYGAGVRPGRDDYVRLEQTGQSEVQTAEDAFASVLDGVGSSKTPTAMTSHLIPAQLLLDKVHLLNKPKPDSILICGHAVVNVVASVDQIMERRSQDIRDRGAMSEAQLEEQLGLCDLEWTRLQLRSTELGQATTFHEIENVNLNESADQLGAVLRGRTS